MSERESNARREIKEASIGGLAHKLKDTAPQQDDASEEGQGPAGEAPDRGVPADNAAPQQADASGKAGSRRVRRRIGSKRFSNCCGARSRDTKTPGRWPRNWAPGGMVN